MKAILVLACVWMSAVYGESMCDGVSEANCDATIGDDCCDWWVDNGCVNVVCDDEDPVDCDDDLEMNDWTVDYIGKSTQFRLYDPCDGKFIKFKMEDLTEYTSDAQKTKFKETSFASSKDWYFYTDPDQSERITNIFHADTLTKVDASFTLTTVFFREETEIPDPADNSQNITVDRNSLKFSVNITDWALDEATNYLELCVGIMTNKKGTFNFDEDRDVYSNGVFEIENDEVAHCSDGSDIEVTVDQGGNGNNHLDLCYKFASCDGDIEYDPRITFAGGAAVSVVLAFVVSMMSVFIV